jgi:hypothetical protein
MSVMPICAMIDPSFNSTIECTIDCGWHDHFDLRGGHAKQPVRSITSRPLFISVASRS